MLETLDLGEEWLKHLHLQRFDHSSTHTLQTQFLQSRVRKIDLGDCIEHLLSDTSALCCALLFQMSALHLEHVSLFVAESLNCSINEQMWSPDVSLGW